MSETLAVYDEKPVVDSKTIQEFLFSTGTKLSEAQKHMFMQLAIRNQLDPFKREIHAIPYGNDFNIVTGYQVYIQRAEATGKLDGWECMSLHNTKNELTGARITIYRKDFAHAFVWEVALAEFDKGQSNWKKMPEFMIKKVCVGQGFRLAFPNELGGMPYLIEEVEDLQPKNGNKPQEPTAEAGRKLSKAHNDLLQELSDYCKGNKDEMKLVLHSLTTWTDKEGNVHEGKESLYDISDKMAGVALGKLRKQIEEQRDQAT